jgi:hypothetical protein
LVLAQVVQAQLLHQPVHLPGRDAVDAGLLDHRHQGLLGAPAWLQKRWEVAALAQLGDGQLDRADPGVPGAGAYVRRFDIEHTIRLWKQTLHWTLPRPRTPEQADRFTWAVAAGYTQLRLARTIVTDLRLPWEQPLAPEQLTPERVRRRFRAVLAVVGTPASAPKPHGRSPGRPRGTRRGPAPRYPASKRTA